MSCVKTGAVRFSLIVPYFSQKEAHCLNHNEDLFKESYLKFDFELFTLRFNYHISGQFFN